MNLVRISCWSDSDENAIDCEIACDCVNRANVVLGLCKEIFRRDALTYPQADILPAPDSDLGDTCTHTWQGACVHEASKASNKHTPSWTAPKLLSDKSTQASNHLHAFSRRETSLGVRGQMLRPPACTDPKRSILRGQFHAGTTQVDFEVDHQWPVDSPAEDRLIAMVKETVKRLSKEWKKMWNFSDGSCWEIIIIKQIHTLLKQYVAGERVVLLDENVKLVRISH